ncbi:MAG: SDR family oxidoreductase [Rhodospirillales bacterium]|nr:SDR family oxidoreductase [Rhodospirillales bacterium]
MGYPIYTPQCVLITGATSGFGTAFAKRFAANGSRVILHGRNSDKLHQLQEVVEGDTHTICFDVTDHAAMKQALDNLPDGFKDIDCLINNAGGALGLEPAQDANLEDWDSMIATNVTALVHMTRHVLPGMVARGRGHIINIGSIAGNWPYPGGNVYCASKAFVKQFSLALRADLHGTHVRVTNIEPGMAHTDFSLARFKGDKEKADAVYAHTEPLSAEDVAETVYWSATLPAHVNINTLEVMPTAQSFGPLPVERNV